MAIRDHDCTDFLNTQDAICSAVLSCSILYTAVIEI